MWWRTYKLQPVIVQLDKEEIRRRNIFYVFLVAKFLPKICTIIAIVPYCFISRANSLFHFTGEFDYFTITELNLKKSQIYFEKHFKDCVLDSKYIYIRLRIVTSDPHTRYFQYKVLKNVLYLNEKLFSFGISETSRCSFCNQDKETIEHLFRHCFVAKALWNSLNTFFENQLSLYALMPQAAFSGLTEKHLDDNILQNYLLLVFNSL